MKLQKSNKIKITINMQIAFTFLGLLVMVVGVCIFVNSFFLEDYYIKNKLEALRSAYTLVNETVIEEGQDSSELSSDIRSICDIYNINILVLDESSEVVFSTMNDSGRIQRQLFEHLFGGAYTDPLIADSLENRMLEETNKYSIQIISDVSMGNQYIEMWGVLDNGFVFLIRSAVESITDSVKLANRFLIYVGLIAGIISIFIALWASRRISKPVSELTEISERMRELEFDAKYTGHAVNEIGILGENINNLSETLEHTISELRTANNQLERDLDRRTRLDDMRKEFLSNVSHELKTPIALIQGYAEGLKVCVNEDAGERDYYCDVIIDESGKMNSMVSKLLTLNQLEFGNEQVEFERFDVVELINNYLQNVDILIKNSNANVQVSISTSAPVSTLDSNLTATSDSTSVYVWADQFLVYDVLSNYFSNALNHLGGERRIVIDVQKKEKSVRISVFNTGEPIPEESIDYLWDKFYKVDKARTREYGGSGVGLSIVKAIQESINQPYGVRNVDDGVEFYFELAL